MRKVTLRMSVSLDGYVARLDGALDWVFRTTGPAQRAWITASLREVDTTLIGRTTYQEQAAHWPTQTSEIATLVNAHEKVVFSSTLTSVDWQNSRLATGSVAEEVAALKQQPGKNIFVTGGASFARSVIQQHLVDEYYLIVHPVVLGSGRPLFGDLGRQLDLSLVGTRAFDTGGVLLTYSRARA